MSDNYWQDGDDEGETNAMRVLREKAEADSKVIREMAERLQKMEAKETRENLVKTVQGKGLDPKVVDLIPEGKDPQEWLTEYGSLFAAQTAFGDAAADDDAGTDGSDDGVSAEDAAALAALSKIGVDGAAPAAGLASVASKIESFDNAEDLLKFLQSNG